jgi:hypothetical protein
MVVSVSSGSVCGRLDPVEGGDVVDHAAPEFVPAPQLSVAVNGRL